THPSSVRQEAASPLAIGSDDRAVLRRLAEKVAAAASSPGMQQTRDLWRRHNQLELTRPLVFCDPEQGWGEILLPSQCECRTPLARRWELALRRECFWAYSMGDDKPVGPYFDIPMILVKEDWGMETGFRRVAQRGSYAWESPLKNYQTDLKRLHAPQMEVDLNTSRAMLQLARDLFGDLLCVRLVGVWWWSLGLTMRAAHLRGLEQLHYDFIDHPDEVKELMGLLASGTMQKLDFLEANGLLTLNNEGTYVGSGGFGFTDELPQADFSGRVRCRDLWGFADSQETAHISPAMYAEFVFPYEKPILDRFGLNCYGCCEPIHGRWPHVARHGNLRRVSCSPWADLREMAAALEDKYILSMKPNPAALAMPKIDAEAVRRSLRESLEMTRGCIVEIVMKDNHTLGGNPNNATDWCRIAKEEANRLAG
ncbi:MAG: hypothetical protein U1E05_08585, partial [Patescibacteria group bacterium]|nr:hypothetical protein [Patescibacteria group bacterium]